MVHPVTKTELIETPIGVAIPVLPSRIQNPPRPENPGELLKNYNLAHPGPVLKTTENY